MKKPILKGPKLIAVGPLKCFKGGGGGSGGGGGGGSSSGGGKGGGGGGGSTQSGLMGDVAKERERVRQVERDAQAGRERDAAQARKREEYKKQQAAAEAKAKAEQKRKEDQQRQQAKAKAEAMAKAAQRRQRERQKQEAKVKAEAVAKAAQLRRAREADDSVVQQIDDRAVNQRADDLRRARELDDLAVKQMDEQEAKATQDLADDLRIARGAEDLVSQEMDSDLSLSKALEKQDLQRRKDARDRKQLEEAEDLRVARGAEYEEQRDLKIDLAKRQASELSAQRRKEDEQREAARQKAEEIAFSKTLEQRDLDLRKDARARQEEERTLSRELARRRSDKALAEEADEEIERSEKLREQIAADPRFGSEEEFEAFKDAQEEKTPEEIAEDQRRAEEAYVASQDAKRDRMALMDYEKGLISAQEYGALTGNEKIPRKSVLTRRNFIEALGLLPGGAGAPVKNIAKFINRKISDPTTMEEAQEDIAVEAEKKEGGKKTDSKKPLNVTTRSGGDRSSAAPAPTPVAPAPPVAAPAPAPTPKPVEELTPDEVGDSIVKKEAQLIRERSLAQQLAQIRGLRGVSPGQKARLLQRSQERFDREFAPQVQLAIMKERETRRKEQQDLSEAEKNRQNALERQKLASGKGVVSSASDKPSWLQGLEAVSTGLNKADDILSTFDFDFGNILGGAEGGFVSGPGTEMSDSIPARLSDGEFVIRASAVRGIGKAMGAKGKEEERKKGVDFLYKLQDRMHKVEKFAEGGEAYSRPKKAFKEAIGYESESRFHDKAFKDTKDGGAKRKFRHFQMGGDVDMKGPGVVKDQFKMPSSGYGAVVSAQGDLMRRIEELERKVGK